MKPQNIYFFVGIIVCFIIASVAWVLGKTFPLIGGAVFGIFLGMVLTSFFHRRISTIQPGASFAGKKILQYSIILLGFEMNIKDVIEVGASSLYIMIFTLAATFITAYIMAKLLKIDSVTGTLIGVGTAICGGSAIAATAPIIKAGNKEIAYAISTIFLFNIAAVFLFPFLGHLLNLSNPAFGIWAGTAINDTSSVVAAGFSYSQESGALATIVKLTRTLMIIPITFVLSLYMAKQSNDGESAKFNLFKAVPYFIVGFIITAIINSLHILPLNITQFLASFGKFLIIVAMVGIGLNTHLGQLLKNGIRPIIMGAVCWFVLAIVALIVQHYSGLL